jgi:5'(3')-deoxyribonucleotidase
VNLALDLDGVLANSAAVYLDILNTKYRDIVMAKYGREMKMSDLNKWGIYEEVLGSKEEERKVFKEAWRRWEDIPPAEDGLDEKVRRLGEFGIVYIVTVRHGIEDLRNVANWLVEQGIEAQGVLSVPWRVGRRGGKAEYDFFNVFIDDAPHLAERAVAKGKIMIVRDQPWNRDLPRDVERLVFRVRSLDEAIKVLEGLRK